MMERLYLAFQQASARWTPHYVDLTPDRRWRIDDVVRFSGSKLRWRVSKAEGNVTHFKPVRYHEIARHAR